MSDQLDSVVYLDFRKAFDAISHNLFTDKLMKCRISKWTVRWTENWLNCWAQRGPTGGEVQSPTLQQEELRSPAPGEE